MSHVLRYSFDDEPSRALAAVDPELGALIDRIGKVEIEVSGGGFEVMAESIVWQQISAKAGMAIWRKLTERIGSTPEAIAGATHDDLRAAGLSNRKAEYVAAIARATVTGEVDWQALEHQDDETVIEELSKLRGVGRWTAEMYLIFALGRPDVLALDDLGILSSAGRMAGLGRAMTREELAVRGELWRPWRSAASLYLWTD